MEQLSLFDESYVVVLDQELWIVDRVDGRVLTLPVVGYSDLKPIRLRSLAGGNVTVLPAGSTATIVVHL